MTFGEKIYKQIEKRKVIEIGEVKLTVAYLYSEKYEIVVKGIAHKKKYILTIKERKTKEELFNCEGTLNNVLSRATGYVLNY